MEIVLKGISNNEVEVNVDNELQVALNQDYTRVGYAIMSCHETDRDSVGHDTPLEGSEDYRLRIGIDNPYFIHRPLGTVFNTNIFKQINSAGMSISVEDGAYTMNTMATTLANEYCSIQTWRTFQLNKAFSLYGEVDILFPDSLIFGQSLDIGFFNYTGISDNMPGAFMRMTSSLVAAYVKYRYQVADRMAGGTFDTVYSINANQYYKIGVLMSSDDVHFYINGVLVSVVKPIGNPFYAAYGKAQLPFVVRLSNNGVLAVGGKVKVGDISIQLMDAEITKDWGQVMGSMGNNSIQTPNGVTPSQTANNTNNTVSPTASLSNITGSYNTYGGSFIFTSPAGAETDYALFAYQIPVENSIYIRSIDINITLVGTTITTTPTIIEWSLGVGSSSESLATAESDITKAPRIITLGNTCFKVGEISGTTKIVSKSFNSGMFASNGCYVHIIIRIPVSTVTSSQTFRGEVSIDGFWE